jgi:prepilin-type N-terminal cleavage/methylation domain-containing protein
MKNIHTKKGFSLIEVLIVIAIIGILVSLAIPSYSNNKKNARDVERITEIDTISLALDMYYSVCKRYPATLTVTANDGCSGTTTLGEYLNTIPVPPRTPPNAYAYDTDAGGTTYRVGTVLELNNSALQRDIDTDLGTVSCDEALEYCKGK